MKMKLEIASDAHAVYLRFSDKPAVRTVSASQIPNATAFDLDKDGTIVGIEFLGVEDVEIEKNHQRWQP